MDEHHSLEKTLDELIEEIAELPQSLHPAHQDRQNHFLKKVKKEADTPISRQDSLDELRLCLKYLLFDLESTRRENRYLKKLLDKDS